MPIYCTYIVCQYVEWLLSRNNRVDLTFYLAIKFSLPATYKARYKHPLVLALKQSALKFIAFTVDKNKPERVSLC